MQKMHLIQNLSVLSCAQNKRVLFLLFPILLCLLTLWVCGVHLADVCVCGEKKKKHLTEVAK